MHLSSVVTRTLVTLGPALASAHDSSALYKRTGAGFSHRRVFGSRRSEDLMTKSTSASDTSESAALELVKCPHTELMFPDLGFTMPSTIPSSLDGWWTYSSEYAFMGFSYEVTACESVNHDPTDAHSSNNFVLGGGRPRLVGTQERLFEHP
jgi:hypothetical protein